jgi:hypothetical protein
MAAAGCFKPFLACVYCLQNAASNVDIVAEASDHMRKHRCESVSQPFPFLFVSPTLPAASNKLFGFSTVGNHA